MHQSPGLEHITDTAVRGAEPNGRRVHEAAAGAPMIPGVLVGEAQQLAVGVVDERSNAGRPRAAVGKDSQGAGGGGAERLILGGDVPATGASSVYASVSSENMLRIGIDLSSN
ncbi:hypothetical protein [Rhodococcus opacus]|nr:hypothetical protein [Rhodococcus opacus]